MEEARGATNEVDLMCYQARFRAAIGVGNIKLTSCHGDLHEMKILMMFSYLKQRT
jgi:hypothetical protein